MTRNERRKRFHQYAGMSREEYLAVVLPNLASMDKAQVVEALMDRIEGVVLVAGKPWKRLRLPKEGDAIPEVVSVVRQMAVLCAVYPPPASTGVNNGQQLTPASQSVIAALLKIPACRSLDVDFVLSQAEMTSLLIANARKERGE